MGKYADIVADTETIKRESERVFKAYDTDGSGYLEKTELKKPMEDLMSALGFDPKTLPEEAIKAGIDETLSKLDTNKDGKLSPEEFLEFAKGYFGILAMQEESK